MTHPRLQGGFGHTILALSLSVFVAACSGSDSGLRTTDGGGAIGETGGSPAAGGSVGTGGSGTGGAPVGSGGISGSGGKAGFGGSTGTGGTTGLGGVIGTGGRAASGGSSGSDGGLGGVMSTGGSAALGGMTGTGGKSAAGGTLGTGGRSASGGATGTGGGSGTGGTTGAAGEFGFTYRPVQDKELDWLCTLRKVGQSTYVYVRLDQTGTQSVGIATIPVYTARLAQISVSGTVSDLGNAQYDYGGGHHNDSLQIEYQGKSYKYYHSSFGFGFRQCQPMDCVNVYPQGSTTPEVEGCSSTRALPEVCVAIKADGTHDPLVDTFKKCSGDSSN